MNTPSFFAILLVIAGLTAGKSQGQDPGSLRAASIKALEEEIKLLKAGKDSEAKGKHLEIQGTIGTLIAVETPGNRGLDAPPVSADPEKKTIFTPLQKAGFRLQREPGPADEAKPAEFSFTRDLDARSSSYFADFFLAWDRPITDGRDAQLELSTQGKLRTGDLASDAWIFRGDAVLQNHPGWLDGLHTELGVKEESDREMAHNRLSGEIMFTPTLGAWAIGTSRDDPHLNASGRPDDGPANLPAVRFRWRPYFGADVGTWLSEPAVGAQKTSVRGSVRVTEDLQLNFLASALDLADASLFADETATFTNGDGTHTYLKTGLSLMINDNVGFALTYHLGEDAPLFKREQSLTASLTVKF